MPIHALLSTVCYTQNVQRELKAQANGQRNCIDVHSLEHLPTPLQFSLRYIYKLDNLAKLSRCSMVKVMINEQDIYERIKQVLANAPRNQYTAELHLQMIKYADELKNITAKDFCEGVGLTQSFGTEFSKMRNLTQRLKTAGLNTDLL